MNGQRNGLRVAMSEVRGAECLRGPVPVVPSVSSERRVLLVLDERNLHISAREEHGPKAKVGYRKIYEWAQGFGQLDRAAVYTVYDERRSQQRNGFFEWLTDQGYHVEKQAPKRWADGTLEGDVDATLGFDLGRAACAYETFIIGSGDGDLTKSVEWLVRNNRNVIVLGVEKHMAADLKMAATRWTTLESMGGISNATQKAEQAA